MRWTALAYAAVLLAGRAAADESKPSADWIRADLSSPVATEVAWALHDAVEARLPDVDDLVRQILLDWAGDDAVARAVRTAAIDVVIELDVELPDDLLLATALDTGGPRQLLLAARKPAACRDVLRALLTAPLVEDEAWIAACNLLAPQRDSVLTAHLLSLLRLEAILTAVDPGDDGLVGVGTGASGRFGVADRCASASTTDGHLGSVGVC